MRTGTERPLVVLDAVDVADGIKQITFGNPAGGVLPSWRPGAHVSLLLPLGDETERQYSLCGPSLNPGTWTIAVRLETVADGGRGGSAWVHENLVPGAVIEGRGPLNHFILGRAEHYEFVAGGIGITPLIPMIAEVEAKGASWRLSYAGRNRASMAFVDSLLATYPDKVDVYASAEGNRLDVEALVGTHTPGTKVYTCGPHKLTDALEAATAAWPEGTFHTEHFAARELKAPLRAEPFEVELIYSGQTITVTPEQTVLEAAQEAGAFVAASCLEGTCGTCETTVVLGEVDHRDSILSPAECARGDRMMICVSRAAGPFISLEL